MGQLAKELMQAQQMITPSANTLQSRRRDLVTAQRGRERDQREVFDRDQAGLMNQMIMMGNLFQEKWTGDTAQGKKLMEAYTHILPRNTANKYKLGGLHDVLFNPKFYQSPQEAQQKQIEAAIAQLQVKDAYNISPKHTEAVTQQAEHRGINRAKLDVAEAHELELLAHEYPTEVESVRASNTFINPKSNATALGKLLEKTQKTYRYEAAYNMLSTLDPETTQSFIKSRKSVFSSRSTQLQTGVLAVEPFTNAKGESIPTKNGSGVLTNRDVGAMQDRLEDKLVALLGTGPGSIKRGSLSDAEIQQLTKIFKFLEATDSYLAYKYAGTYSNATEAKRGRQRNLTYVVGQPLKISRL